MHKTWLNVLKDEMSKTRFSALADFVKSQRKVTTVYPSEMNVFSWTKKSLNEIKASSCLSEFYFETVFKMM